MSYYPGAPVTLNPRRWQASSAHVAIAWILTVLTVGYLLPWAVAATRSKQNTGAIALINVLLGWSLIGWVVALVMACTAEPVTQTVFVPTYAPPAAWPTQPPPLPGPPPQPGYPPPAANEPTRPLWPT